MNTFARTTKAAQYVRMSTDYQQYSTLNQKTVISAYAEIRGIEIVATYEDAGKSGLTFSGRPALRQLISDVAAGQDRFSTILVYDVSRWGRFQDADESAHLEYLCKLAGVQIKYCAEPFENDGTPFASICKVVKRALAAEYSRELSDKVFKGQKRLIELGFRLGGSPGIGLRRCLIDSQGRRKGLLATGERKNITTDRVILIPGPSNEIKIVRGIYRDYLKRGMGSSAIAAKLNRNDVPSESGRPWTRAVVKRVLTSEKYIGNSVWARSSFKLQIAREHNPPETWARRQGAFDGIISRQLFEEAQRERARRNSKIADDDVITRLRLILRKHGKLTAQLIRKDRFVCVASIRKRFGSLLTAYELAGYRPKRDLAFIDHGKAAQRLRATVAEEILKGLSFRGHDVERLSGACRFLVNRELRITVSVVQQRQSQRGDPRWLVKPDMGDADLRIAVLADGHSDRASAYYFFPSNQFRKERLLSASNPADLAVFRSDTLEPLFNLCSRRQIDFEAMLIGGCCDPNITSLQCLPALIDERRQLPCLPTKPCKSYAIAFKKGFGHLRLAIERASAVEARLDVLRGLLLGLFAKPGFILALRGEEIGSIPQSVFRVERHFMETQENRFRQGLFVAATGFLAGQTISPRVRRLLARMNDKWRIEAAELIILADDRTEQFARALVASTPQRCLRLPSRKRVYGADLKRLKAMEAERALAIAKAKPAFAMFVRNALDLVAVEAFVKRIMKRQVIEKCISRTDRTALHLLSSIK